MSLGWVLSWELTSPLPMHFWVGLVLSGHQWVAGRSWTLRTQGSHFNGTSSFQSWYTHRAPERGWGGQFLANKRNMGRKRVGEISSICQHRFVWKSWYELFFFFLKIWPMGQNWAVVSNIFYFFPYLGKNPILTNIFQRGWNHQLENDKIWFSTFQVFERFDKACLPLKTDPAWSPCLPPGDDFNDFFRSTGRAWLARPWARGWTALWRRRRAASSVDSHNFSSWKLTGIIKLPILGDQTMQIYGDVVGFPLQ